MRKMASCDAQGSVFILDDAVYRVIPPDQTVAVSLILDKTTKEKITGIVQTEKCLFAPPDIENNNDTLILKHRKISFITYPHEWCASMLKDAALFHLSLSEQLLQYKLFIKDAHPWNVLFEKHNPVLIDFTSIVSIESLFTEGYLQSNTSLQTTDMDTRLSGLLNEIFTRMYLPYFLFPLLAYFHGDGKMVRKMIKDTTLNASAKAMSFSSVFLSDKKIHLRPARLLNSITNYIKFKLELKKLTTTKNISNFYKNTKEQTSKLNSNHIQSPYLAYYNEKPEYQNWSFSGEWNAKQKIVHEALLSPKITTVLDVACNTGWFAILAEKLGKAVIAFDIDEACIEKLYAKTKESNLNILPLVIDITDLTQDSFSVHDGKTILINTTERLQSDLVIALGILHHLSLGLGLSFDQVLDTLTPLAKKQILIEFVDISDPLIINEPEFFPAHSAKNELADTYRLEHFVTSCQDRGFIVECKTSHPPTRTIVDCQWPEEK